MTLMTKGDFARHRGVGKSAVSNWAKKGLLVMGECPTSGALKVDVERTEARINTRIDPMRGRPSAGAPSAPTPASEGGDFVSGGRTGAHVRVELAEEQLVSKRLANAERAGELGVQIELERRAGELGRIMRERIHSMFRSIAERLAAERDVRTIMSIGAAEIDGVFAQMANDAENGALADADDGVEDAALENDLAEALAEV
ncbi:hypothetical protein [Sphingomonas sp. PAMC 26605]|uniref:hypothetical protein n=1 Tax=Sphingomonas sp. PAMC 26605 TaxID=1112214 RepID=UPI00026CDCB5|nr:hypothetical protein [Sphingomonas sp. PAMC 26605]